MDLTNELLQISAKLYQLLSSSIPKGEERSQYIDRINFLLDEQGKIIDALKAQNFQLNKEIKSHAMLMELNRRIGEKLQLVMEEVKKDLRDIQNTKKNEKHYMNPYSNVQVMDGMYYDRKS
jgi:flagellar protein FliT